MFAVLNACLLVERENQKDEISHNRGEPHWEEAAVEGSQHGQQQSQAHKETTLAPLLTLTGSQDRLRLRCTLINERLFPKADESLVRKPEAHPVLSQQEDLY